MRKGIVLIGMMGAGKTTVGLLLSERLGMQFFDCDEVFEKRHGAILSYFHTYGEPSFRDKESDIISDLSKKRGAVIATGGGAVIRSGNIERLRNNSDIIFLYAGTAELDRRLMGSRVRPLYSAGKLGDIWTKRKDLYSSLADFKVDTESLTPAGVCEEIEKLIKSRG